MYYIVNLDNQVVAADSDFLSLLKIDHLQELFTRLINGELKLNEIGSNTLEIVTDIETITLTRNKYALSTLMGDLHLIELSRIEEAAPAAIDLTETTDDEVKFIIDDKEDDFVTFDIKPEKETDTEEEIDLIPDEEETEEEINLLPDEESHFLKPAEETVSKKEEPAEEIEEETLSLSDESVFVDTEKISKILGISKEDYSGFLDEFIDKAIDQEEAVKDTGSAEHQKAALSLHKLAQMLHLTALSDILEKAEKTSGKKEKQAIEAFYHALSNLTTHAAKSNDIVLEPREETYENQICDLVLEDVKPIHFDFQLEAASKDLSLPVDLIEEFVNDFIAQAHEEKEKFIDLCKKGDIDEIHRLGHKLKGVASNLRINPLADTLEEIQFCEDRSRFEPLLKKYWGQFLAFELYMNSITNQEGGK